MNENIKILVVHPGKQHSFRVATALNHNNMLAGYITTVYDKETSFIMRVCKSVLFGDNLKRAQKRKCDQIEDSQVIQFCEISGLFLLLVNRLDKKKKFFNWLMRHQSDRFQKKVAHYIIKNNIPVVISYDYNSEILFETLINEAPEVIKIMDNAACCRNFIYKHYSEGARYCGKFMNTFYEEFMDSEETAQEWTKEALLADFHIVASSFAASALKYNGIEEDKIIIAPYGVDLEFFKPRKIENTDSVLKVLYVGEINQRKGIYQILEAAKTLREYDIEFHLVGGGKEVHSELYEPYEQYVKFYGAIVPQDLKKLYAMADVFILPTMGEGFGLVLLEALASGLPVISSKYCAGPDVIQEGYNGFLIDAYEKEQLIEKIKWFYDNKSMLPIMSANARESVLQYTWENYEKKLIEGIKEKLN